MKNEAHGYDVSILGKIGEGEKAQVRIDATELSDGSIRLTVFVTDEKLKENIRNILHVNPILPPLPPKD